MLYRPQCHRCHWHRAPKTSRSYLLLQFSCYFIHASSYSFSFSLKIAKFSAFRTNCFSFSYFFQFFYCMLSQIILFLKPLESLPYFRGLKTFLGIGPPKSWIRLWARLSEAFVCPRHSSVRGVPLSEAFI